MKYDVKVESKVAHNDPMKFRQETFHGCNEEEFAFLKKAAAKNNFSITVKEVR